MTTYTDADLCPDCGHPGYDGHDMRSQGWPCLTCACGHEDDRDWRLDRWLEALYGARLHMFALIHRPDLPTDPAERERAIAWGAATYHLWARLYRRPVR